MPAKHPMKTAPNDRRLTLPTGMQRVQLLLSGWTAIVLVFLYLPIVILIIYSFNRSALNIVWEGFTFHWYRELLSPGNAPLIDAMKNSLIVAVFTTLLSVPLGTAGAWVLYRYRFPMRRLLSTLAFLPVVMPEVIMGISLLIFFVVVDTWGNGLLARVGIGGRPMDLGFTTLILSHVTFCFPFVMIPVQARLEGLDPSLEEAAMDLGATPLRAFWYVLAPYLLPAIAAGALMAFTLSLDELIVTYFTKGLNSATLPIKIFGMARSGLNPTLNAISAIFIVSTAIFAVCAEYLRKLNR